MGKLVRDRIPEIIRETGRTPSVRRLENDEYEEALHDKLLEEATELREAATRDDRIEEAADVLEVLLGVAELRGFTLDDILQSAESKRIARGGFTDRVWLERT